MARRADCSRQVQARLHTQSWPWGPRPDGQPPAYAVVMAEGQVTLTYPSHKRQDRCWSRIYDGVKKIKNCRGPPLTFLSELLIFKLTFLSTFFKLTYFFEFLSKFTFLGTFQNYFYFLSDFLLFEYFLSKILLFFSTFLSEFSFLVLCQYFFETFGHLLWFTYPL